MSMSPQQLVQGGGDDLRVFPARVRRALVCIGMLIVVVLAFLRTFGFPPTFRVSLDHIIGVILLPPLGAAVVLGLLGLLSPFPMFSISHDGVRTYSLFGWFGTELIPWCHVRRITTYQSDRQQFLKIYSDHQLRPGQWRLIRPLLRHESELLRVYVSSGSMSGSMDVLLEQIEKRFADEIDANGVALIDFGER